MPFNNDNEAQSSIRAWIFLTVILVVFLAVKAPGALFAIVAGLTAVLYGIGRIIGLFFGA